MGVHFRVQFGFMSTSFDKNVCISYMDQHGPNILWELMPTHETDEGFHIGADVSFLSQYPGEKEILVCHSCHPSATRGPTGP